MRQSAIVGNSIHYFLALDDAARRRKNEALKDRSHWIEKEAFFLLCDCNWKNECTKNLRHVFLLPCFDNLYGYY
jgi:hypothetical protein